MTSLFMSYRRSDSGGWTGRLYDRLAEALGADRIFYDIDSIAPGQDFAVAVEERLRASDVVLVVIGPGWLDARSVDGHRRLDDADDQVRREIEVALRLPVKLIPVLVAGAEMPDAGRLPPPLAPLATRNALRISDASFSTDVRRLIEAKGPATEKSRADRPTTPAREPTFAEVLVGHRWEARSETLGGPGRRVLADFKDGGTFEGYSRYLRETFSQRPERQRRMARRGAEALPEIHLRRGRNPEQDGDSNRGAEHTLDKLEGVDKWDRLWQFKRLEP
jgi:hypothetical protein